MTVEIEPVAEERTTNNMDFFDLYEDLKTIIERKLSKEIIEQQLSKIVIDMVSAVGWQVNSTRDEISKGFQDDLSIDLCE